MAKSWYRKWRPTKFSSVIGQDHVVRTLRHALSRGAVSHAYLFTGPRGVGKTTTARLLAKSVNCQSPIVKDGFDPCGKCATCKEFENESMVDVIEIDAASNRSIDDIRTLKDFISLAPVLGAYKVYIIDEVHMLSKDAFNALLKTLEEPPAHVIFILATTEVNKVPETILSRCQRFDFHPISEEELAKHLIYIAKEEGVEITKEGAEMLAEAASGSGRDAISLFQQVSVGEQKLDTKEITELLGFVPVEQIREVLKLCYNDEALALKFIANLIGQGSDPEQCVRAVMHNLAKMLKHEGKEDWQKELTSGQVITAFEAWSWAHKHLKAHPEPYLVLATAAVRTNQAWSNTVEKVEIIAPIKPRVPVVEQKVTDAPEDHPATISVQKWDPSEDHRQFWAKFIEAAKPHNHSLAALLKDAELLGITEGEPNDLNIGVRFTFHRGRLQEIKNRQILEGVLKEMTGKTWRIICSLVVNKGKTEEQPVSEDKLLDAAKEMFEG